MDAAPGIPALDPDSGQPFPVSLTLCLSLCGADVAVPSRALRRQPALPEEAPHAGRPGRQASTCYGAGTSVPGVRAGRTSCPGRTGSGSQGAVCGVWAPRPPVHGAGASTGTHVLVSSVPVNERGRKHRASAGGSTSCLFLLTFCVLVPFCTFWDMSSISAATRVHDSSSRRLVSGSEASRGIAPSWHRLHLPNEVSSLSEDADHSSTLFVWRFLLPRGPGTTPATVAAGLSVSRSNLRADSLPDGNVKTADAASSQSKRVVRAPGSGQTRGSEPPQQGPQAASGRDCPLASRLCLRVRQPRSPRAFLYTSHLPYLSRLPLPLGNCCYLQIKRLENCVTSKMDSDGDPGAECATPAAPGVSLPAQACRAGRQTSPG